MWTINSLINFLLWFMPPVNTIKSRICSHTGLSESSLCPHWLCDPRYLTTAIFPSAISEPVSISLWHIENNHYLWQYVFGIFQSLRWSFRIFSMLCTLCLSESLQAHFPAASSFCSLLGNSRRYGFLQTWHPHRGWTSLAFPRNLADLPRWGVTWTMRAVHSNLSCSWFSLCFIKHQSKQWSYCSLIMGSIWPGQTFKCHRAIICHTVQCGQLIYGFIFSGWHIVW